jgi:hypothetical protein
MIAAGGALWASWMGGEDGEAGTEDRVWGVTIEFVMCWIVRCGGIQNWGLDCLVIS